MRTSPLPNKRTHEHGYIPVFVRSLVREGRCSHVRGRYSAVGCREGEAVFACSEVFAYSEGRPYGKECSSGREYSARRPSCGASVCRAGPSIPRAGPSALVRAACPPCRPSVGRAGRRFFLNIMEKMPQGLDKGGGDVVSLLRRFLLCVRFFSACGIFCLTHSQVPTLCR